MKDRFEAKASNFFSIEQLTYEQTEQMLKGPCSPVCDLPTYYLSTFKVTTAFGCFLSH
ncbi:MAG: hypothetical protein AAFZ15_27350 [Bacteroidota bacterium]